MDFKKQSNLGGADHSNLDSVSSCSESSSLFASDSMEEEKEEEEEEEEEEVSSSTSSSSSSSSLNHQNNDPLQDMSSLIQQLPLIRRRGLSKHYPWKSQSFTSLAKVSCLEDLAKPEKPYNNKMMMKRKRKSYGGGLSDHDHSHRSNSLSRIISKKAITRGGSYCSSFSSQTAKRNSRPPMPSPPNSTINCISNSNQTALFAST